MKPLKLYAQILKIFVNNFHKSVQMIVVDMVFVLLVKLVNVNIFIRVHLVLKNKVVITMTIKFVHNCKKLVLHNH